MTNHNKPRIVTPQEAQEVLTPDNEWEARLLHTVAAEPERIASAERAAVVKALREVSHQLREDTERLRVALAKNPGVTWASTPVDVLLDERAEAIENGAPL